MGSVGRGGRSSRRKSTILSSTYENRRQPILLLKIRVSAVQFCPWPPFFKDLSQPVTRVLWRFYLRQWPISGPTRAAAVST